MRRRYNMDSMSNDIKQEESPVLSREWVRFGAKEACRIEKIGTLLEEWSQEVLEDAAPGRKAFVCSLLDNDRSHLVGNLFCTSAFVKGTPEELAALEQRVTAVDDRITLKKLQGNFEVAERECYRDSTVQNLLWTITTKDRTKITIVENHKGADFFLNEGDGKHASLMREGKMRSVAQVLFHPDREDKLILKGFREKIRGKGKEDCLYLVLPCNYCACILLPKKDPRLIAWGQETKADYSEEVDWMFLRGIAKRHIERVKEYLEKWTAKGDQSKHQNMVAEVYEATYTDVKLSKATGQRMKRTVAVMPGMLLLKCSERMLFETIPEDIHGEDTYDWKDVGFANNYLTKHVLLNKETRRPVHTTERAVAVFKQALGNFDKLSKMDPKEKLKAGWVRVCDETSPFYMLVGKMAECKRKEDRAAGLCNFVIAACYELMTDKFSVKVKLTDLEPYADAEYDVIEKRLKKAKQRKR